MRFHLDEHVDHAVALGLRLRGIDVTTTTDAKLVGANDQDHIAFAAREHRVIVTSDADFLHLHHQGVDHSGIVFVPRDRLTVGDMVRGLLLINACLTENEMERHVEFLLQDA